MDGSIHTASTASNNNKITLWLILLTLACSISFGAQPWTVRTKLAQAHTHAAWFISVDTSSSTRVSYTSLLNFCTRSTTLALTCLLDSEQQASSMDDDDNQVIHRHDDTPHMVQLDYNIHRVTAAWSCAASTNLLSLWIRLLLVAPALVLLY